MCFNNLFKRFSKSKNGEDEHEAKPKKQSGFWMTVLKVEVADIAFAVDSILAAVALAVTLPIIPNVGEIGGMHAGHFVVIFAGGFIGLVIMRFAANLFVKLLAKKPGLETAAFLIVGWVGVKLAVLTLSHNAVGILPESFAHSTTWSIIFYGVLVVIALGGWFLSKDVKHEEANTEKVENVNV